MSFSIKVAPRKDATGAIIHAVGVQREAGFDGREPPGQLLPARATIGSCWETSGKREKSVFDRGGGCVGSGRSLAVDRIELE